MIEMFKNIVSSENDAKKYHLKSYHEMLEVALLKDYELNQNFLKSIQQEFNISEYEHSVIIQAITDSNEKLNVNIIETLQKMQYLCDMNNNIYEDYTVEIFFLKKIIQEEFNKDSRHLFSLLDGIYINHQTEFKACKQAFSYDQNELMGLNSRVYEFLSPTIVNELEKIHAKLYNPVYASKDHNQSIITALLTLENENINIATIVAYKNYSMPTSNLNIFLNHKNKEITILVNKILSNSKKMSVYENMAYLSMVPLFSALNFQELYSVAMKSHLESFEEKTSVIKQGEDTNNLYVIVSGEVEVYKDTKKINELSSGDFFGEIAIVAKTKRTASIVSITKLSVLVFCEEAFNSLINKYPNISVQIMKVMTKRLLQNNS